MIDSYDEIEDYEDYDWSSSGWHRWIAEAEKKGGYGRIDYSVLSVGVMTLGLIMMVEFLRHRLDHAAKGRPFFKAVLEGVYEELATLGIVELFVYILQTYYEGMDKAKKEVFAKVHFMLFYTAIINAIQSVLLAVLTTRISRRIWVQTEMLELNHYVEIREAFEQVKRELDVAKSDGRTVASTRSNNSDAPEHDGSHSGSKLGRKSYAEQFTERAETAFEFSRDGFRKAYRGIVLLMRYPTLKRQYNQLLVQVRFHELRVHLLQSYSLPLKLRISDYLMRSEQKVLIRLVHVSTVAWLLLTGATNILYYVLGIVSYETADVEIVGTAMTWIFFCSMTLIVLLSLVLYNKMISIFGAIMHDRSLWDVNSIEEESSQRAAQQLALFWGSDPKLVIAAVQFMQFGYSVAFSLVIIFWETIQEGPIGMHWYIFAVFVCYGLFLMVAGQIIPRFTLCTSLGQLVDRQRLHETVALFHLEEAKRAQLEKTLLKQYEDRYLALQDATDHHDRASDDKVHSDRTETQSTASSVTSSRRPSIDAASLMAELVKLDTDSLRTNLPASERELLSQRQMDRRQRRRNRLKSVSDGVRLMQSLHGMTIADSEPFGSQNLSLRMALDDSAIGKRRKPSLSRDNSSQHMQSDALAAEDTRLDRLRERRRQRKTRMKTVSDGVATMAMHRDRDRYSSLFVPDYVAEEASMHAGDDSHTGHSASEDVLVETASDEMDLQLNTFRVRRFNDDDSVDEKKTERLQVSFAPNVEKMIGNQDLMDADDSSMRSLASDGGQSDDGDIPEIDATLAIPHFEHKKKTHNSVEFLQSFFTSRRYVLVSNIFGTMIAFFFVGQRVERFLHTENIIEPGDFVSFDLQQRITFWILTGYFASFLVVSASIMYIVDPKVSSRYRKVFTAAILDFVLVACCLTLFFVAEAQRCCHPEDGVHRHLETVSYNLGPAPCSCPRFGSRTYGGLGMIEPFVSLFTLRVFRNWFAKRVLNIFDRQELKGMSNGEKNAGQSEGIQLDPFDVFNEIEKLGGHPAVHDGHHGAEDRGTAAELWEAAIGKYPDIVAKYGEFSGELLRVMLGLEVIEEKVSSAKGEGEISSLVRTGRAPARTKSFVLGKEYSSLSTEAQEVIVAGKLGCKVKSVNNLLALAQDEEEDNGYGVEEAVPRKRFFEVDAQSDQIDDQLIVFTSPNARLVRSMRRCDRVLLPLLGKWSVVDVVLTRFEMVYFDAVDADAEQLSADAKGVKDALFVTKGGKGLRLCDVATGRRVVGHLQLSEISAIYVDREMPSTQQDSHTTPSIEGPDVNVESSEFWKPSHHMVDRAMQWGRVKQDRLRIETIHGRTLLLRFYGDLDDSLYHPEHHVDENEENGAIFKDNAFQWVQTIGRFCGPEQLKQQLPHFGDDSHDELRDYLVVHHHENELKKHRRILSGHDQRFRQLQRGMSSVGRSFMIRRPDPVRRTVSQGHGEESTENENTNQLLRRPSVLRRVLSHGESLPTEGSTQPLKPLFRRASSVGESNSGRHVGVNPLYHKSRSFHGGNLPGTNEKDQDDENEIS